MRVCMCVRNVVCILVWKTIIYSVFLTEYDPHLEIDLRS